MFKVPEHFRVGKEQSKYLGSTKEEGNNGCFLVTFPRIKEQFLVIASDKLGWEHVSVSLPNKTPTWDHMCMVKDMFWSDEDTVVQYHPAKKNYVNNHKHCLHLWKPTNAELPLPDSILVGVTDKNQISILKN